MTCFWKGILDCLNQNDFHNRNKPNIINFIHFLKKNNIKCSGILWQNQNLSEQFLSECKMAVKELDIGGINNGYLCSTCDPFLILVSKLFRINIRHNYCNHIINYKNPNSNRWIRVRSNRGHFQKD